MPKVVGRNSTTGELREVTVPELLIVRKQGRNWITIKACESFMTHNAPTRNVTFNVAGWYQVDNRDPEFFFNGQTWNCGGGVTYFRGPFE